jgi:hypothetical protein
MTEVRVPLVTCRNTQREGEEKKLKIIYKSVVKT